MLKNMTEPRLILACFAVTTDANCPRYVPLVGA
jgi:hypothetical protein